MGDHRINPTRYLHKPPSPIKKVGSKSRRTKGEGARRSQKSFDVLVAGEINPDLILSGNVEPAFGQAEKIVDAAILTVGSSSAILACGAARLGMKVTFVGICGIDIFGRFMLDEMSKGGVDVSPVIVDSNQATGLSVILNRGDDRAILTHTGCIAALRAEQVGNSLLKQARHLHVSSYFLQTALRPGLPDLFHRARALGLTTSLDTNWDPSGDWHGLDELLHLADIFLPNEQEALALTGAATVEEATIRLSRICRTVAVKLGARGAIARRGAETAQTPAVKGNLIDTVGAGDSFDAGFLYGWLKDWTLEKTLRLAAVCGSLSTRAAGGTAAQPTLKEALSYAN